MFKPSYPAAIVSVGVAAVEVSFDSSQKPASDCLVLVKVVVGGLVLMGAAHGLIY